MSTAGVTRKARVRHLAVRFSVIAAYAALCLLWGSTWYGIKVSISYVAPFTALGIRLLIAGIAVFVLARFTGVKQSRSGRTILVFAACLFGLNYALSYFAETHVSSGLTAVLFATLPFFVFMFSGWLTGERATALMWAAAAISFAGVAVISLTGSESGALPYELMAVGAAAVGAVGQAYARRRTDVEPLAVMPHALCVSAVIMLIIGIGTEHTDWNRLVSTPSIVAMLYLALCGTALAYWLNLWLLHQISAASVGFFALITPVVALAIGAAIGHETVSPRDVAGSALVLAGTAAALFRRGAQLGKQPIDVTLGCVEVTDRGS